jgi:hypothetical protein
VPKRWCKVVEVTRRTGLDDQFLRVLAGRLLSDFAAQTDRQATNKEKSWRAHLSRRASTASHDSMSGRYRSTAAPCRSRRVRSVGRLLIA